MTTTIEDNELEAELQELYLVDKQWLSDLEFLDTEFQFLRKLATANSVSIVSNKALNNVLGVEKMYKRLKRDMLAYLHVLEPLIIAKTKTIDLPIIENYSQLKQRLDEMFQQCQKLKKDIFKASKPDISGPIYQAG